MDSLIRAAGIAALVIGLAFAVHNVNGAWIEPRYLGFQSYADYALQTRVMLGLPPDAPIEREPIARELVAFVLGGCGIER